jgi:uncharacterized protein YgiM (DUF1202 family)
MDSHVGAVTTGGGNLYVRATPSTGGTILASLKKGSYVTLIEKSGDWWKVEYAQSKFGYCYGQYITPVEGTAVKVSTDGDVLNVRSGPGTTYHRIATLPHGSIVLLRSTENGWSRILYHGTKTGYVSAAYLSSAPVSTGIALDVPSFKQYDSRWANRTIGQSGKTFSQIGCATTAIAMMESYRTGSVILPHNMASQLRYTPDGSVYWPSHYQVTTNNANYLEKIRDLLTAGKPVLFGARTAGGKQHWVVITGFTGGTLSPANFIIHDPGSNSRVNLQQFLNAYPVFYKYFSY